MEKERRDVKVMRQGCSMSACTYACHTCVCTDACACTCLVAELGGAERDDDEREEQRRSQPRAATRVAARSVRGCGTQLKGREREACVDG
jgi:hypothetical protein